MRYSSCITQPGFRQVQLYVWISSSFCTSQVSPSLPRFAGKLQPDQPLSVLPSEHKTNQFASYLQKYFFKNLFQNVKSMSLRQEPLIPKALKKQLFGEKNVLRCPRLFLFYFKSHMQTVCIINLINGLLNRVS